MNKDICYSYDGRLLEYGLLRPYSNIFAFSTTRHGGCSEGNYASFNANPYCGDQTDCVSRNRDLLVSLCLSNRKNWWFPIRYMRARF